MLRRLRLLLLALLSIGCSVCVGAVTPSFSACPSAVASLLGPSNPCCPEGYALTATDNSGSCLPYKCCTPTFFRAKQCTTSSGVANDIAVCGFLGDMAYNGYG